MDQTSPEARDATASRRPRAAHIDLIAGTGWGGLARRAAADIAQACRLWRLVAALAMMDIKLRYRGSVIGPFWLTLSTAVLVGALGIVYATLLHLKLAHYLPFLALSLVLWGFLSGLVTEGCVCFSTAEAMIHGMRMPFAVHAARVVLRNLVVLAHNLVVIVAVFLIFHVSPGPRALLALPGLALWLVDGFAVALLLGAFCARFRDVPPIIASVLQIAFYVSPVTWTPDILGGRHLRVLLLDANPFNAMLEIVRAPLLGQVPDARILAAALGYSGLLILLAGAAFVRTRGRIAFWV